METSPVRYILLGLNEHRLPSSVNIYFFLLSNQGEVESASLIRPSCVLESVKIAFSNSFAGARDTRALRTSNRKSVWGKIAEVTSSDVPSEDAP